MSLLPPVTADRFVPAPLFRRLAAAVYDVLPLAGVLVMAEALATGLGRLLLGAEGYGQHAGLAGNPWNTSFVFLVCFAYYGGFWVHGGQTLGLRTWKLRVQLPGGGRIGWWHALLRFLAGLAWLVPGL
ncbi:RDD family protein, partial [Plasticicumulans sp.]